MKCSRHPDKDAVTQCQSCNAYMCETCSEATKILQDYCGTLCIDCCIKLLKEELAAYTKERGRIIRNIIFNILFYIAGWAVIIVATQVGGVLGFLILICGLILCGIYVGLTGWANAAAAHDEKEARYGPSYKVEGKKVVRDNGTGQKAANFIVCALFGVIVTPIGIIKNIVWLVRSKKDVEHVNEYIEKYQNV